MQSPLNGSAYWAARVVDAEPAAAVRSIVLHALDSAVQFPVPLPDGVGRVRFTDGNVDGPVVKLAGSATLREASAPGRMTVFRVDAPASPFHEGQDLVALRSSIDRGLVPADGLPTTRFVQYVGVYRDSDWAPPREGAGRILGP